MDCSFGKPRITLALLSLPFLSCILLFPVFFPPAQLSPSRSRSAGEPQTFPHCPSAASSLFTRVVCSATPEPGRNFPSWTAFQTPRVFWLRALQPGAQEGGSAKNVEAPPASCSAAQGAGGPQRFSPATLPCVRNLLSNNKDSTPLVFLRSIFLSLFFPTFVSKYKLVLK